MVYRDFTLSFALNLSYIWHSSNILPVLTRFDAGVDLFFVADILLRCPAQGEKNAEAQMWNRMNYVLLTSSNLRQTLLKCWLQHLKTTSAHCRCFVFGIAIEGGRKTAASADGLTEANDGRTILRAPSQVPWPSEYTNDDLSKHIDNQKSLFCSFYRLRLPLASHGPHL